MLRSIKVVGMCLAASLGGCGTVNPYYLYPSLGDREIWWSLETCALGFDVCRIRPIHSIDDQTSLVVLENNCRQTDFNGDPAIYCHGLRSTNPDGLVFGKSPQPTEQAYKLLRNSDAICMSTTVLNLKTKEIGGGVSLSRNGERTGLRLSKTDAQALHSGFVPLSKFCEQLYIQ